MVDDTPVPLLRDGELIYAIHDRCSLSEGKAEEPQGGLFVDLHRFQEQPSRTSPPNAPERGNSARASSSFSTIPTGSPKPAG